MAVRLFMAALAVALIVALVPASAGARQGCGHSVAPPGNSEADEYSETVPGPCGNQTPDGSGSNDAVSATTLAQLQALGADGQGAAALAAKTTPGRRPGAGVEAVSEGGGSPLAGIVGGLTDDSGDGMGALLPVILIGALGAGLAFLVLNRRRTS